MKLFFLMCLLVMGINSSRAETPFEVRRLLEQREAAIEKINLTSAQKLQELKKFYMKQGDLVSANSAEETRKQVELGNGSSLSSPSVFEKEVVGRKWSWRHKRDKKSWFILRSDGSAHVSFHKGKTKWRLFENRTVGLYLSGPKRIVIISWEPDFKSYTAVERDFKLKIRGRELK